MCFLVNLAKFPRIPEYLFYRTSPVAASAEWMQILVAVAYTSHYSKWYEKNTEEELEAYSESN